MGYLFKVTKAVLRSINDAKAQSTGRRSFRRRRFFESARMTSFPVYGLRECLQALVSSVRSIINAPVTRKLDQPREVLDQYRARPKGK